MVQKHDATRLHWDLRLELDGVLKSWAVTRGPSLDPHDKRLAVRTEDHPLSYATFEGTIPKGEYGGGTVMLWDRGTWTPSPGKDPRKTLDEGHLHFTLDGERMKGEWILVRLKPRPGEKRENWLLRKVEDALCRRLGRAGRRAPDQRQDRPDDGRDRRGQEGDRASKAQDGQSQGQQAPRRRTRKAPPFQPRPARDAGRRGAGRIGWIHEMKYDGYRCLLAVGGGKASVYTRIGARLDRQVPRDRRGRRRARSRQRLLDGEIVSLDAKGNPELLGAAGRDQRGRARASPCSCSTCSSSTARICAGCPISSARSGSRRCSAPAPPLPSSTPSISSARARNCSRRCARRARKGSSRRRPTRPIAARATKTWLKVKCTRRQEFVIVGWTRERQEGARLPLAAARRARERQAALRRQGRHRLLGRRCSTNCSTQLRKLETAKTRRSRCRAPEARGAHWVKPKLVAEIAFAEFTADGVVRHAQLPRPARRQGGQGGRRRKARAGREDRSRGRGRRSRSPTPTG